MEKSFFGRFKGHLKAESQGGRYLGVVLAECINAEPSIAKAVWGNSFVFNSDKHIATTEWCFEGDRQGRRADLVILELKSNKPIALAEIKYEDDKCPETFAQISDYLNFSERADIPFTYLTKNDAKSEDYKAILKAGKPRKSILYGEMFEALRKNEHGNPVKKMLCDFLREEGYVFEPFNDEDQKSLILLISRGCSFPPRNGLGRKQATEDRIQRKVPEILSRAISNAHVLGLSLYEECSDVLGNRPIPGFKFAPRIDPTKIGKHQNSSGQIWLPSNCVTGGALLTTSTMSISGDSGWMNISVILKFDLDIPEVGDGNSSKINTDICVEISGSRIELNIKRSPWLWRENSGMQQAGTRILELARKAADDAIGVESKPDYQLKRLKALRKVLTQT